MEALSLEFPDRQRNRGKDYNAIQMLKRSENAESKEYSLRVQRAINIENGEIVKWALESVS